jgi:hypothetical protein
MRAGNIPNNEIAKKIGCHPWASSDVIIRGSGPDVIVPEKIKEAAMKTVHFRPRTGTRKKKIVTLPGMTLATALPTFVEACMQFEKAHDDCISMGVPEDTLQLMAMSVKEKVTPKVKP